jgi:hypothetical protein
MTKTSWDTSELLTYCSKQYTDDAAIYFKALQQKIKRIHFLKKEIEKSPKFPFPDFDINNKSDKHKFLEPGLLILTHTESIAHNLHSLPDVLAHIINVIILDPLGSRLESRKINIKKIKDINNTLQKDSSLESWRKQYYKDIVDAINNLLECDEYKYINAFVNTIKHRHLIDNEYLFKINQTIHISDWQFIEFERDNTLYPSITITKLINDDQEKIINIFCEVGEKINNYCRADSITNK